MCLVHTQGDLSIINLFPGPPSWICSVQTRQTKYGWMNELEQFYYNYNRTGFLPSFLFLPSPKASWLLGVSEVSVGWKHKPNQRCPKNISLLDKRHLHYHCGTLISKTWNLIKKTDSVKWSAVIIDITISAGTSMRTLQFFEPLTYGV